MIFTVVCALILLQEADAYSTSGLGLVLSCTALCVLGIYVVTLKSNLVIASQTSKAYENAAANLDEKNEKLLSLKSENNFEKPEKSYLLKFFT
mmetsp:Transcript_9985/g.12524  ORF Transcript_9985/g.12524 Transcript_9985/m.12524 type:complete len:93 (-) Transcript_9985:266-544(-)